MSDPLASSGPSDRDALPTPTGRPDGGRSESLRTELAALTAILPPVAGGERADLVPSLQAALGGAYVLERELGGGGMSRVFVATETALDRRVAVKVLSPELLQGVSAERFAREVSLAARLQDPHIVPVLTTGATADGLPYYTMPFIEGESLRDRLARGPVPLDEALRILRDVAEALEYAHARGIVHRDIKPENVLLSGRSAVVADFGIAKAMSAARASGPQGGTLTSIGLSLGTPAYMAPEQAAGDAVDHRVDLYAWGMMAWELLAGRHPFAPRTQAAQLMAAQLTELPAPIDTVRPGLPPTLGALVMACVAKAPDARPADAATVLAALGGATTDLAITSGRRAPVAAASSRRTTMLVAAAAVLALGAGGAWLATRDGATAGAAAAAASATPSLAVLPFEHQGDTADAYLTEGITDEIRNKLTGVPNLLVIARASSMPYKGKATSPQAIAKELGVRWLLTGTVRVLGTGDQRRVLVRPELVEVTADGRLQSKGGTPFDGALTDVVKAQGDVAGQVVRSMELAVGGADRATFDKAPTTDAEAYDLYLRGLAAIGGGVSTDAMSLRRGLVLFEQATLRDPDMLEAWAMVGRSYAYLYTNDKPAASYERGARNALRRLESLAPGSAPTFRTRAFVHRFLERDLDRAREAAEAAHRLAPSDLQALTMLSTVQGELGRFEDAVRYSDEALRLDPRSAQAQMNRGRLFLRMRRLADARAAASRARAIAPGSVTATDLQIVVELAAGDLAAARRVLTGGFADVPRDALLVYIGQYWDTWWVATGDDERRLLELPPEAYNSTTGAHTVRAQMHAAKGDAQRARIAADSSIAILEAELREAPTDPQRHLIRGLMLAIGGRTTDAIRAVGRGLALGDAAASMRQSNSNGYYHVLAAKAAVAAGDRTRAITWIREALALRPIYTAAWIRLDPSFAPLRGDPAFERVLTEAP